MDPKLRILLLSPYDAMSHQAWRRSLEADLTNALDACVSVVVLAARFFSWRHRGNSLTLSHDERLMQDYDLVIATSITDLSTLKGLRTNLANTPTILYFHENQFAYPDNQIERQVERQITSIYSAIAADRLLFNSQFNQQTFLSGAKQLLDRMPDGVPPGVIDRLEEKCDVVSVPISISTVSAAAMGGSYSAEGSYQAEGSYPAEGSNGTTATQMVDRPGGVSIVWNHRWEHDKGLEELLELIVALQASELDFTFHLIGQQFRQVPAVVENIKSQLGSQLGQCGFVEDRSDYLALLKDTDIVLSTARHEFQGLAVLEAIACGCTPIVPDALAYREFVPDEYRYSTHPEAVQTITALARGNKPRGCVLLPRSVTPNYVLEQWRQQILPLT